MEINPKYTADFTELVAKEYLARLSTNEKGEFINELATYSIQVEGDFNVDGVPVKLKAKFMSNRINQREDEELEDLILHYLIKGRKVDILLDSDIVGSVIVTGLNDSWDAFPVFKDHPISFSTFQNVAMFSVIKKSMPPLKKGITATVEAKAQAVVTKS